MVVQQWLLLSFRNALLSRNSLESAPANRFDQKMLFGERQPAKATIGQALEGGGAPDQTRAFRIESFESKLGAKRKDFRNKSQKIY